MTVNETISLRKMSHVLEDGILLYTLGSQAMNELIGQELRLKFEGDINCIACGRAIKKTFNQGYCYPCFRALAQCDSCIIKPEKCHYEAGTCREPAWGESHCLIPHVVYLANATGLKVGVTGAHKVLERWGDQGALSAMVIARVPQRLVAGRLEVAMKELVADKSNWRALLKGEVQDINLLEEFARLRQAVPEEFQEYLLTEEEAAESLQRLAYPVESYLDKASTWNFDKTPEVSGILHGIRGQYLLVGDRGINIRKFQGYKVTVQA